MDRLLFGDNQFFGVNHMSEEKARAQSMRFQEIQAVIDVLDNAYDEGIKIFMCTTHDRIALVCDHMRANPDRYYRILVSSLYAVCAQVCKRRNRGRHVGCAEAVHAR